MKQNCWKTSWRLLKKQVTIDKLCLTLCSKTMQDRWLICRLTIQLKLWWCSKMQCRCSLWDSRWLDSRCRGTTWCNKQGKCTWCRQCKTRPSSSSEWGWWAAEWWEVWVVQLHPWLMLIKLKWWPWDRDRCRCKCRWIKWDSRIWCNVKQ